jgi:hypothetical protein
MATKAALLAMALARGATRTERRLVGIPRPDAGVITNAEGSPGNEEEVRK